MSAGEHDIEVPRLHAKRAAESDALRCRRCGYDLAGLELPAACPECGKRWTGEALAELRHAKIPILGWLSRRSRSTPTVSLIIAGAFALIVTLAYSRPHGVEYLGVFGAFYCGLIAFVGPVYAILRALAWFAAWMPERMLGQKPTRRQTACAVLPVLLFAYGWATALSGWPFVVRFRLTEPAIIARASENASPHLGDPEWIGALRARWVQLGPRSGGLAFYRPMSLGGSYELLIYSPDKPPLPTPAHKRWFDEHGEWPEELNWLETYELRPGWWRLWLDAGQLRELVEEEQNDE